MRLLWLFQLSRVMLVRHRNLLLLLLHLSSWLLVIKVELYVCLSRVTLVRHRNLLLLLLHLSSWMLVIKFELYVCLGNRLVGVELFFLIAFI